MDAVLRTLVITGLALLAGCAAGPRFDTAGIDTGTTPRRAVAEAERLAGQRVLWGGMVIETTNLAERTRLEVLGYPLDASQRPDTDAEPLGRFLVTRSGYLESVDYRTGRLVTVVGPVTGVRDGRVGEAPYRYPVVGAERIHLWPARYGPGATRVHFGVGVIFSN